MPFSMDATMHRFVPTPSGASIHGGSMPGLQAMRAGAKRIGVRYADLRNGAAITYTTADPALVSAIHAWFKAQVSDHGADASMTM